MHCNEQTADSLKDFCQELQKISSTIMDVKFKDEDHIGFMGLCFLSKQTDHMSAILKLYPHPDIRLISRTMIEGLTQLLWCFRNPNKALQWRAFAWVSDWRLSKSMQTDGKSVSNEYMQTIEDSLKTHGDMFKKKKLSANSDPFHANWRCGKTLKDISSEVGGDSLYKMIYSPFSDWQHWGASSIGGMIRRKENSVSYGSCNPKDQLCAPLAVAYQCLYQVLELVDKHHRIGVFDKLNEINEKYIKYHKNAESGSGAQ